MEQSQRVNNGGKIHMSSCYCSTVCSIISDSIQRWCLTGFVFNCICGSKGGGGVGGKGGGGGCVCATFAILP